MSNPELLRAALRNYQSVRFGAKPAELPGGANDLTHSISLIREYAAWIHARALDLDAYWNTLDGVNLEDIRTVMHSLDPAGAVALGSKFASVKNPDGARLAVKWVIWRDALDVYLAGLASDIGTWTGWLVWTPGVGAIAQLFNPLSHAWDDLRGHHAEMLDFRAQLAATKAIGVPEIAAVPRSDIGWKEALGVLNDERKKGQETLNYALIAAGIIGAFLLVRELKGSPK